MSSLKTTNYDTIIVGGGAAGFFAAINLAKAHPNLRIAIIEKSKEVLQKVKISGGGRCNVTHACFDPNELVEYYPRGNKALLGPFHQFAPGDMMHWLDQHGVPTKIENDNRVFPESNESQSIIDCFNKLIRKHKIELIPKCRLDELQAQNNGWKLICGDKVFNCKKVLVTTGSSPQVWKLLSKLGHTITAPVPSLFTFPCKDTKIKDLLGISVPHAAVKVINSKLSDEGPLLITHWGFSGPAVLKLSAWGARELHDKKYDFSIAVNWVYPEDENSTKDYLNRYKTNHPKQQVSTRSHFDIPKRLWVRMIAAAKISPTENWADLSKEKINALTLELAGAEYKIKGKSTFKEEFVTAGGVNLNEVNFKTFESKICPGLFFAGEVLDIDAITGGFNFQAAWTGAWIAAQNLA